MAILARTLLQSAPPAPARRALAEALAMTDVPGVAYFLAQALQHPDSEVRVAAVLGLARGGNESDLSAIEAALSDEDSAVREAAVRALTSLGIDAAERRLERVLLEGDDMLRPIAAEALAKYGKESADFLREAVESEDVMTRRAAVFGLAQIGAWDVLEKVMREDEQWIVRTAAATALEERERTPGITPPPEIEQLPWLISWAAAQGTGVGVGDAARRMLWRALSEGDVPVRLAAAQVLIRIGRPDDVEPLRAALNHPAPVVASAAFEALAEISRRYDLRIER
jgi:HEAT repeat protein